MIKPSFEVWPIVARWRQQSSDGSITWHLAVLRADRGFWGYVHFRTRSRQENRSFQGTLDAQAIERIADLVKEVARYAGDATRPHPLDGVIGIGTRSSFRMIFGICDGVAVPDHTSAVLAYRELIDVIQPRLAANIVQ